MPVEWIGEIKPGRKPVSEYRRSSEYPENIDNDQRTIQGSSSARRQDNEWVRIVKTFVWNETEEEFHASINRPTPDYLKGKIHCKYLCIYIEFLKFCKATYKESPLDSLKSNAPQEEFLKAFGESFQPEYLTPRYKCDYRTTVFATFYDANGIEIETKDNIPMVVVDKKNPNKYKYEVLPGEERFVVFTIPDKATSWKVWVPR